MPLAEKDVPVLPGLDRVRVHPSSVIPSRRQYWRGL
jgi:hypothetical protein